MTHGYRLGRRKARFGGQALALAVLASLLVACGGVPAEQTAAGDSGRPQAVDAPSAPSAPADASFQATVAGDVELTVEGANALAGARFGRYHLNFSGQQQGDGGAVIISLARADTASPQPGRYRLGEDGDFDGNIEIHPGPADYAIEEGELVITDANGDQLAGRYVFSAGERAGSATIAVEGSFQTRPVD